MLSGDARGYIFGNSQATLALAECSESLPDVLERERDMKLKAIGLVVSAGITASCGAGFLSAQDASISAAGDKTFLMNADESNSAEIAASQMALKKSKNPDVKAYAQQMIADHQKLRSDMASLTQQMGVMTPQPLNETHKAEAKRLAALSGKSFDMEYVKTMDQDHHKTLGVFNNEIATTSNADLKTTVSQGQSVIEKHTEMADQMVQKMNITTGVSPGS